MLWSRLGAISASQDQRPDVYGKVEYIRVVSLPARLFVIRHAHVKKSRLSHQTSTVSPLMAEMRSNKVSVPEWDQFKAQETSTTTAVPAKHASHGTSFNARFDSILPPHKRYLRLSRRWFMIALGVVLLLLLALIIGLSVGLTERKNS